jgi:RNA 2',3'-cyclic 3'-phosphodiesterase
VRLFVALAPSPEARSHLAEAVAPLREQIDGLRWTDPDAWHLTLAFLGSVDESRLSALNQRLARAALRHSVLHLAFRGAGAFGGRRRARVLWVGLTGDREPLRRLAGSVGAAARRAGIPIEDRAYRPHLTLARARTPTDVTSAVDTLAAYHGPAWTASEVVLMRSHLGRQTRYEPLRRWALRLGAESER